MRSLHASVKELLPLNHMHEVLGFLLLPPALIIWTCYFPNQNYFYCGLKYRLFKEAMLILAYLNVDDSKEKTKP